MHRRLYWLAALAVMLAAVSCTLSTGDTTTPSPTPGNLAPVDLIVYLAAPDSGGPTGCGSTLIPVTRGTLPAMTVEQQITRALQELFSIKEQFVGQSGLYNALYQSNLSVTGVTVDTSGQATVQLSGDYTLQGVCSDALFRAQIEQTALQFAINRVAVFIDGRPLAEIVSGRGSDAP